MMALESIFSPLLGFVTRNSPSPHGKDRYETSRKKWQNLKWMSWLGARVSLRGPRVALQRPTLIIKMNRDVWTGWLDSVKDGRKGRLLSVIIGQSDFRIDVHLFPINQIGPNSAT